MRSVCTPLAFPPQGRPGAAGLASGFGQATYTHAAAAPGEYLDANTRTPILFEPDPALSSDYLNPPFRGHVFWDGHRIVGRALADFLFAQVNLRVTPEVAGGTVTVDLDAGSSVGSLVSDTFDLDRSVQVEQRVTLKLFFQTLGNVMANGAAPYVTSTVPARIMRESVLVMPLSLYLPGALP